MGEARYMKSCPLEHIHNPRYETLHLNHKWNTCIFYFFGLKLKAQNKAEEKKTAEHSISRFKTRAELSSLAHSGPVLLLKKRRKAGSTPSHTHTHAYLLMLKNYESSPEIEGIEISWRRKSLERLVRRGLLMGRETEQNFEKCHGTGMSKMSESLRLSRDPRWEKPTF